MPAQGMQENMEGVCTIWSWDPCTHPSDCADARELGSHVPAQEMQENMEGVRTIWSMQMDAARNRLIHIELNVAIASLAVVVMTVPGAMFGMNLESGLEVGMLLCTGRHAVGHALNRVVSVLAWFRGCC